MPRSDGSPWRRWPAWGLAALFAVTISLDVIAREGDDPEEQLKRIEDAIRERETKGKGLDSEVSDASSELEQIRREQIDVAAQIQDQETQLGDAEADIADIERRYAERQASFEKHRAELERTLAALAIFARSPPQALIARPGDWGDTVRGLKLLDNAIPALRESADAAAAEAAALAALRDARTRRQSELAANRTQLNELHAELQRLHERKSSYYATLIADQRRNAREISALAEQATDTRDLIDRIEMAEAEEAARQADEAAAEAAATPPDANDEMVVAAVPPDAPNEPTADEPVAERPPSPATPEAAQPDIAPDDDARLANATPDLTQTPVETESPGVAAAPEVRPADPDEVAEGLSDADQVAAIAPPQLESPVEPNAARPDAAPPLDLEAPDSAAPDSDAANGPRLTNTNPTSSEPVADGSATAPAASPTADLPATGSEGAAPDSDPANAPRLANPIPPSADAAGETGGTAPAAAPTADLPATGSEEAAPDSDLANAIPAAINAAGETGGAVPAAAPTVDLPAAGSEEVAPAEDVPMRLAALPIAPPPPPVKSSLPFPAHGDVIARFGTRGENGRTSLGASILTRERAQVVAPRPGRVVFAGPFRGYGQLLILEHDGGYHSLLSGFSRIDAQVGQEVLAGEPVGVMGMVAESATILYIEIRPKKRQPIDPIPWLMEGDRKVSG